LAGPEGKRVSIRREKGSQQERRAYHNLARREEDMKEREGKGNGPYQGPSGTSGKINGHKKMMVDGRSERG
jgi:hypothetical protein